MKALDGLDGYADLGLSHAELLNKQSASGSKFPVQKKAFIKFVSILVRSYGKLVSDYSI